MKIHVNTINLKTRLRLLIISLTNTSFIVSVTILNPKVLVKCLWFVRSMSTHAQGNNFDPPRQVLDSYYERMSNVLLDDMLQVVKAVEIIEESSTQFRQIN